MIQKCPVCEGRGQVPQGFYLDSYDNTITAPQECRACKGAGTVGFADMQPDYYWHIPVDPSGTVY